jgi:hypothetical protein
MPPAKVPADLDAFPGTRTEVSLTLPKGLSYKQTERLLGVIGVIERASPWWGCDALLYAEAAFGEERFSQIAEALGWAPDVLSTRLWVARAVAPARRRETLSFSHHAEVAALEADDQDYWLGLAEAGEALPNGETKPWSKTHLRGELRVLVPRNPRGRKGKRRTSPAPAPAPAPAPEFAGEFAAAQTEVAPQGEEAAAAVAERSDAAVDVKAALLVEEALERMETRTRVTGILLETGMLIRSADGPPHRIVGIYLAPGEVIVKAVSVAVVAPEEPLGALDHAAAETGWAEAKWGTPEALAHLYNTQAPDNVPAVETLSPKRRANARKLLKTFPHRSWWEEVFTEYHKSKFLSGRAKPDAEHAHFKPDFDWLLANGKKGAENVVRVHDGVYRQ